MQNERNNLSNAMYHATKWSAITNVMRKLIAPVTNMVLARLLSPDAFGVVASINMVISFAEIFADAGFQKYLVQHEFDDNKALYKSANVAFWTNFAISMAIWLGIVLFRNPIALLVGSEGYGLHLAVAGFAIPLVSFSSIQQALYRRNFNFRGLFLPRLVNALIPLVVTIPLAYFTRNCWALIIGTLCANVSDAVMLTVRSNWKPRRYYSLQELKEMFSFSAWTLLESISIWLTVNVDVFILGRMMSSYYLGLYKTSITTVNQISTLITTTILPVLFAGLSRYQNDKNKFEETFYLFQCKSAIILIPMSIGMFLYKDVITWVLLGEQWSEVIPFIGLLGFMQAFTVLYANFASEVYRSMGEPQTSFVAQIAYIAMIIPSIMYGAKLGFDALCIIRTILKAIFVCMHLFILKIRYGMRLQKMVKSIAEPMVASLVMALAGWLMRAQTESMALRLASILPCVVIYFSVCLVFKDTRYSLLAFVKKIKKRM